VRPAGESLAKIRLQEQTVPMQVFQGASGCRYFTAGYQFTLQDHYRGDLNQAYLITSVRHMATQGGNYQVGAGGGEEQTYRNTLECIPAATPFRPARVTPEPFVQGCQTAVVVGPSGEEIYTDKYGRVKVQFYWDREGKRNENSSCWIRVSHPWAGQGWGAVSIPRIGQEVIVDFLEGDPDRPIIVGRVYNAEQMPPNGLPAAGMVSGIKSNSTPGGGGYNEMSMDDTKGKEKMNVHAQYDMTVTVEHDRTKTINNNETTKVVANRTEHVIGHESITIDSGREEKVSSGEKITISGGRTEIVSDGEKINITGGRTENVTGGETITITGAQNITVNGSRTESVTSGEQVTITGNTTHTVTGDLTLHATGAFGQLGDGGVTINGPTITVQAKGDCNIIGGSKLTLAGPGGSIVIDGSGVTIQGTVVNIN
jgi:type VI secretion system secreted protein VgrG